MSVIWTPDAPLDGAAGNTQGYSYRQVFPASPAPGTRVRVWFKSATDGNRLILDHASLAILGSATAPNTQSPVALSFNGSPGLNIAPGIEIASDWLNFPISIGDVPVVILDESSDALGGRAAYGSSVTNASLHYKAGAATYNQASVSGFATAPGVFAISKIEIDNGLPPVGTKPRFSAYMVGSQSLPPGAHQVVGFDHATFDSDFQFDPVTHQVTIRKAGCYLYWVSICFAGPISDGVSQQVEFRVNGSQYEQDIPPRSGPGTIGWSSMVECDVGDVIDVTAYVSSGSGLSITGQSCRFEMLWVADLVGSAAART